MHHRDIKIAEMSTRQQKVKQYWVVLLSTRSKRFKTLNCRKIGQIYFCRISSTKKFCNAILTICYQFKSWKQTLYCMGFRYFRGTISLNPNGILYHLVSTSKYVWNLVKHELEIQHNCSWQVTNMSFSDTKSGDST